MNNDLVNEFITKYLLYYSNNKEAIDDKENNNNAIVSEFLGRFNVKTMSIDEYCFEKGNTNSYCYWIDYQLNDLCDIHILKTGAFQKYHIQKINGTYKFMRKNQKSNWAGLTKDDVFKNVKHEILKIIDSSRSLDDTSLAVIENSRLHESFKAKLTFVYNQQMWVPILVKDDIDRIIKHFGVVVSSDASLTRKRVELYNQFYKRLLDSGLNISTWQFMRFIYDDEGYRHIVKGREITHKTKIVNRKTKSDYCHKIDIASIQVVDNSFYEKTDVIFTTGEDEIKIDDFIRQEKINNVIGRRGELIVGKYLRSNKRNLGISSIKAPCEKNQHNLHYDFSYILDNAVHYIEVKASSRKDDEAFFQMSAGEHAFLENCLRNGDDYKIYYVSDVFGNPKVHIINPLDIVDKMTISKYRFYGKLI